MEKFKFWPFPKHDIDLSQIDPKDFEKFPSDIKVIVLQKMLTDLAIEALLGTPNEDELHADADNIKDEILYYLQETKKSQKEAAEALGKSPAAFHNQLTRGSLRYDEAKTLANALGLEIVWRRKGDKDK